MRRTVLPLLALAAAACGGGRAPANTMPTPESHAALYFPTTSGTIHGPYTCSDCHDPQATSFAQFDCLHCHDGAHSDATAVAALHAGVAAFTFASDACYKCHRDGVGVNHVPLFPIASGAHAGIGCAECHTDLANRGDTSTLACAGCHQQRDASLAAKHAGATIPVVDYAASSPACLRCHADGQVDRTASHPAGDSTPLGNTRHRSVGCTTCHSGYRNDKAWGASWSTTPGCVTCHPNGIGGN